ncbi:hypothetical protein BV25DRAFT_1900087 [Artomyces pyxidatus]|uniref:Uncharacterized protein n=1 Tax=Artomyces pyxidatus TaxID=48021 RepID=A0ACB8SZK3_9AGAM|nr:hypothetical protein BV25DRAFT_1900087 [Artomyces pyxidatus]
MLCRPVHVACGAERNCICSFVYYSSRFAMEPLGEPITTRAITVFCGSSPGNSPAYKHAATSLGHALAAQKRPLVYGGGSSGLMGTVASAAMERGGQVTGVIPAPAYMIPQPQAESLATKTAQKVKDIRAVMALPFSRNSARNDAGAGGHTTTTKDERIYVPSMHERKAEMSRRACGFVGLPGGYGTFEEVLEVITWTQIGIHNKPVILMNVLGFYNPLRALVQGAVREGFIRARNESLVVFLDGPEDQSEHEKFDWGLATLEALDRWVAAHVGVQADRRFVG